MLTCNSKSAAINIYLQLTVPVVALALAVMMTNSGELLEELRKAQKLAISK